MVKIPGSGGDSLHFPSSSPEEGELTGQHARQRRRLPLPLTPIPGNGPFDSAVTSPPQPEADRTSKASKTVLLVQTKNHDHPLDALSQKAPSKAAQDVKDIREMVKGIGVTLTPHEVENVTMPHAFYLDVGRSTSFTVGMARVGIGEMDHDKRAKQVSFALFDQLGEEAAKNVMCFMHQGLFVSLLGKILDNNFIYIELEQKMLRYDVQLKGESVILSVASNFELRRPDEMENTLGRFQARRTISIPLKELQVDPSKVSADRLFPSITSQIQYFPLIERNV